MSQDKANQKKASLLDTAKDLLKRTPAKAFVNRLRRYQYCYKECKESAKGDVIHTRENLVRTALLLSHSIEREMAITSDKPLRGIHRVEELYSVVSELSSSFPTETFAISESESVLSEWARWQERLNPSVVDSNATVRDLLTNLPKPSPLNDLPSGASLYHPYNEPALTAAYAELVEGRHSIREFSDEPVSKDKLLEAICLAQRAPSACNRQSCKIYVSGNGSARVISRLVHGNRGFEKHIHQWLVITSDRSLYSSSETFQWLLDGGIFLYSTVLSLHAFGIESCIHQWASSDNSAELRDALGIAECEAICAVVAIGYPAENAKVLAASRKNTTDIVNFCS